MKSGNKHHFGLIFLGIFFSTLFVLGGVQALFGTLRLYNSSEESYERLDTAKALASHADGASISSDERDVQIYYADNRDDIETALQTLEPEKAQKIVIKIGQSTIYTPLDQKSHESEDIYVSPVTISTLPDGVAAPKGYISTMQHVLTGVYFRDVLWGFPIKIDTKRVSPRGQMSNQSITLGGKISTLNEVAKVLVHEIGHIIDIYLLKGTTFTSDPSADFYTISWSEPTVLKKGMSSQAFVSGYAASNQYEDFAESFVMYIFHNKTFLKRASLNEHLQEKYDFLQQKVFGDSFQDSSSEKDAVPSRIWDVTKVVIRTDALTEVFAWITKKSAQIL